MGSLTSRPKVPQVMQQPVVYTIAAPAPAVNIPTTATSSAGTTTTASSSLTSQTSAADSPSSSAATDEQVQTQARQQNLLSRSRGTFSTILTGFRGLLSQTVSPAPRKTLLGE